MRKKTIGAGISGLAAGAANGLLGAGGGMLLVPLLSRLAGPREEALFPTCVAVILPVCLVSLTVTGLQTGLPWKESLPYLLGSALGGLLAGSLGKKIPTLWLHRILGVLILWGAIRSLC